MQPFAKADIAAVRKVRLVLTDMDETLTYKGQLSAETYAALKTFKVPGSIPSVVPSYTLAVPPTMRRCFRFSGIQSVSAPSPTILMIFPIFRAGLPRDQVAPGLLKRQKRLSHRDFDAEQIGCATHGGSASGIDAGPMTRRIVTRPPRRSGIHPVMAMAYSSADFALSVASSVVNRPRSSGSSTSRPASASRTHASCR